MKKYILKSGVSIFWTRKTTIIMFVLIMIIGCNTKTKQNKPTALSASEVTTTETGDGIKNIKVFYQEGKYGGWPANWGAWNWDNEILVGFTVADHLDTTRGHTFDVGTAYTKFARSLDGGLTWSLEDGYSKGITESTFEHNLGEKSEESISLSEEIDFTNPNFAMTFRARTLLDGPSSFYYTYDRGKKWTGPFKLEVDFEDRRPVGIVSRTDYIVEGPHEMTAFLTVGFRDNNINWREVACVRTIDGGKTWKHLSWVGEEQVNSIMPSSVRLGPSRLLTTIRQTKPPKMVSFLSEDNGITWKQQVNPVLVDSNGNPPALLKLKDGRLCIIYGIRKKETMPDGIGMYVAYSNNEGRSWSNPELLRGKDGAVWDIGYPRAVLLPSGKVVALYYYNNADNGDKHRYIAATIFQP
ncbi:sialidase family protein [Arenibacter palladensis]|uniref:sialidase family protein n=1 Tax=Arenibacter palladensis TaxID=237373 RepID=UPI002FD778DA